MKFTNLIILDNSILNTVGHYYEYAKSVYDAAVKKGYSVEVASHINVESSITQQMNVVPVFRMAMYDKSIALPGFPVLSKRLHTLVFAYRFLMDWLNSGIPQRLDSQSLVFVPTCTEGSLLALLVWMKLFSGKSRPTVVLLFRYDPRFTVKWMAGLMRSLVNANRLMLTTDSELLAEDYKKITSLDFKVLPIPHLPQIPDQPREQSKGNAPLRFVFLGDLRLEKGIDVLVKAIPLLEEELNAGKVELAIQCNIYHHNAILEGLSSELHTLARKYSPRITLVETPLSTEEYYRLLCSSDVVVIPYRKSEYKARTSGILSEAIAAGKIVLTTEGTWMAAQVAKLGSGLIFEDGNPDDVAKGIKQIVKEQESLAARAKEAISQWQEMHNAQNLLQILELY